MKSTLRFIGFLLAGVFALAGCSPAAESPSNARELKIVLDEQNVPCEEFIVSDDGESGQLLTCTDGTASEEAFAYWVWPDIAERDLGMAGFCLNLERLGSGSQALAVGDTVVGLSYSAFYDANAMAEDLSLVLTDGSSFCQSLGHPVAKALSTQDVEVCLAIHDLAEELFAIQVSPPSAGRGKMISGDATDYNAAFYTARNTVRNKFSDEIPNEIRVEIEEIGGLDELFFRAGFLIKELEYLNVFESSSQFERDRKEFLELQGEIVFHLVDLWTVCKGLAPELED